MQTCSGGKRVHRDGVVASNIDSGRARDCGKLETAAKWNSWRKLVRIERRHVGESVIDG